MPLSTHTPLGGLASSLDQIEERLRSLEQRRILLPGGLVLPSYTTPGTGSGVVYPAGWAYTFTSGPSGAAQVFVQAIVSATPDDGSEPGQPVGLARRGHRHEVQETSGYPYAGPGSFTGVLVTGSIGFAVTPNTTHAVRLGVTSVNSNTYTYTWASGFIVCWALSTHTADWTRRGHGATKGEITSRHRRP